MSVFLIFRINLEKNYLPPSSPTYIPTPTSFHQLFLHQIRRNVTAYDDDILVKSKNLDDHPNNLEETFDTLKQYASQSVKVFLQDKGREFFWLLCWQTWYQIQLRQD